MPKQKIRARRQWITHYNEHANVVQGKARKMRYKGVETPDPKSPVKLSPYLGSRITAATRNRYEEKQAEMFKQKYIRDVESKREQIKKQEDKTEDEIQAEINTFNSEQVSEQELEAMAKRFARYQTNKEQKHYKAWLQGKAWFKYKGQNFPVITERFVSEGKDVHEIIKEENDDTKRKRGDTGPAAS